MVSVVGLVVSVVDRYRCWMSRCVCNWRYSVFVVGDTLVLVCFDDYTLLEAHTVLLVENTLVVQTALLVGDALVVNYTSLDPDAESTVLFVDSSLVAVCALVLLEDCRIAVVVRSSQGVENSSRPRCNSGVYSSLVVVCPFVYLWLVFGQGNKAKKISPLVVEERTGGWY